MTRTAFYEDLSLERTLSLPRTRARAYTSIQKWQLSVIKSRKKNTANVFRLMEMRMRRNIFKCSKSPIQRYALKYMPRTWVRHSLQINLGRNITKPFLSNRKTLPDGSANEKETKNNRMRRDYIGNDAEKNSNRRACLYIEGHEALFRYRNAKKKITEREKNLFRIRSDSDFLFTTFRQIQLNSCALLK